MPRTLAQISGLVVDSDINVTSEPPYTWNGGDHSITFRLNNVLCIAMVMIHEGGNAPTVTEADLSTSGAAAITTEATDGDRIAHLKNRVLFNIQQNWGRYVNHMIILVACQQSKPLSTGNIDNFCKMVGLDEQSASTIKFIQHIAAESERYILNRELCAQFESNLFFQYHTNATSTPYLASQSINETRGLNIFTVDELGTISLSMSRPDSIVYARLIPNTALVKIRAILDASGGLPEVWYMGDKALSKFSSKKYTAMKKFFARIFQIDSNTDDLDTASRPTVVDRLTDLLNTIDSTAVIRDQEVAIDGTTNPRTEEDADVDDEEIPGLDQIDI